MTTDGTCVPFLLRFSERIEPRPLVAHHYDAVAQLSLVQVRGVWVFAVDEKFESGTKKTGIGQETTDDD